MPPRRKPGAKLRSAAAAKTAAAAKAKKKAEEETAVVEETEDVEDSTPVVEAGSSELDDTATEPSQDPIVTEEETEEQNQEETEGNEAEYTDVLDETGNDEGTEENEDDILAEDEQADESQEGDEDVEEILEQAEEDVLLAEDDEQAEDEVEEEAQADEEMEVTETGETKAAEEELFTIDKTPMDTEEVASKIDKGGAEKTTPARETRLSKWKARKMAQKSGDAKDDTKPSETEPSPKKKLEEKTIPLRGRVLKISPITLSHLTNSSVTPILRASIGYVIRAKEAKKSKQIQRTLEIWFHSAEEAEEMFVKFYNFNWKVNGVETRIYRIDNVKETDFSLRQWDQTVSPFGLYDGRCMFVSNLPTDATKEQVLGLFDKAINIQLPTDKDGKTEGYAILEFSTRVATSESSKMTVKLGENELTLHTVGMQRMPRSKGFQEKLDADFRKIQQRGHSTDLFYSSGNLRSAQNQNRGKADNKGGQQMGQRRPGQGNQRPSQGNQGNQRPGQGNKGNQRPGQGNQRPGQGNQRPGQGNKGNQRPGQGNKGNQRPGQGNQRPGQGNQRSGQGNQRSGQGNQRSGQANQQNRTGQGNQGSRFSNLNIQKRGSSGGRDDSSPTKRGRRDSGPRNQGRAGNQGGMNFIGGNREMQLREEMLMAQQSLMAQQMSPAMMNRNMQGVGGRRSGGNDIQNIRGELLGQMQHLQHGGLSDPTYLMNLAQRLQQAQGGGGGGYGNF